MKQTKIPRYIDSIPQIFFWELDEFLILAACFGVGIYFGGINTLYGIIAGFFASSKFKEYKAGGLPGQLNHLLHWKRVLNINSIFVNGGKRRIIK